MSTTEGRMIDDVVDLAGKVTHDELLDALARAARFAHDLNGMGPARAFVGFLAGNLEGKASDRVPAPHKGAKP
jgi:hypothetical protein